MAFCHWLKNMKNSPFRKSEKGYFKQRAKQKRAKKAL